MYKFVFFDMDGTVLNTIDDLRNAVNHTMRHFGLPEIDTWQCKHYTGNASRHLIRCSVPDGEDNPRFEEIYNFYVPYYRDHCAIETAPYDGILWLMEQLKAAGVKMAVVSNKPDPAVKNLADVWFPGLLECAIGESPTVRRKPAPDTVFEAMKLMGATAEESVYIGDTEVDIQTAANCGMDCIAVTWGFRDFEEIKDLGAKVYVDDCTALKDEILR